MMMMMNLFLYTFGSVGLYCAGPGDLDFYGHLACQPWRQIQNMSSKQELVIQFIVKEM
jgi:hypothetical protein